MPLSRLPEQPAICSALTGPPLLPQVIAARVRHRAGTYSIDSSRDFFSSSSAEVESSKNWQPIAGRSAAIAYMRDEGFLTREAAGHFRDRRIAERLCAMAKPTTTARALLAGDASVLEADGAPLGIGDALTNDEAKRLSSAWSLGLTCRNCLLSERRRYGGTDAGD